MSIIYDALAQQSAPTAKALPRPAVSWWARQPATYRNLILMAGGLAVGVPFALLMLSNPTPPNAATTQAEAAAAAGHLAPVAATASMPAPPVAPAATMPQAATASEVIPAAQATAPAATVTATTSAPVSTVGDTPAAPPVTPAPQPAAAAAPLLATDASPQPAINIHVEQRTPRQANAAAGASTDEQRVSAAISAVEQAMAEHNLDAANAGLKQLQAQLPPESLTLLRMRAWVAHGANDMHSAEQLYRQVLERVPDDANAGVNVAIIDARRGDVYDARIRLQRLASLYPRSTQVSQALAELDAPRQ